MKSPQLVTAPYAEQIKRWPQTGRHILAQFDDDTIIVYQAYCTEIGRFAVEKGYFGGELVHPGEANKRLPKSGHAVPIEG